MELLDKNIHCSTTEKIHIYFLGDIHEGNANCDIKALKKCVNIIANDNNQSYIIGMGDYVDAINHKDPRFDPIEISNRYHLRDLKNLPKKQIEAVYEVIQPIENKFICLLHGNHEETYSKYNSFDCVDYLHDLLNPHPKKMGYTGIVKLGIIINDKNRNRPSYNFLIALNHGAGGGGMREGYPLNKCHDIFRWINGDIKIMGHLHRMITDTQYFIDYRGQQIIRQKALYGVNGCFLYKSQIGTRGYFENKPSCESNIGMLRLSIYPKRNKIVSNITLDKIEIL